VDHIPDPDFKLDLTLLAGVPEGYDALVLAEMAADAPMTLFVARDDRRLTSVRSCLTYFAPAHRVIEFPAWDCLPYDRTSPKNDIVARRIAALTELAGLSATGNGDGVILLTTVAAIMQRVPGRSIFENVSLTVNAGQGAVREDILSYMEAKGYSRSETVMEPGEYAVRGSIIDLFPPGFGEPLRLDFFGEDLDTIRSFEPFSQMSTGKVDGFLLKPTSEYALDEDSISRFRTGYRALFGAPASEDHIYESVSAGRVARGLEHWLPLFHEEMNTLFDFAPGASVVLDYQAGEAIVARADLVRDSFEARAGFQAKGLAMNEGIYNPIPADRLYLTRDEISSLLTARQAFGFHPFAAPDAAERIVDRGGRPGRDFSDVRAQQERNLYDAVREVVEAECAAGQKVMLTTVSDGSGERLTRILGEHGLKLSHTEAWTALAEDEPATAVLDLERGFKAPGITVITEQDVLGDRLRSSGRRLRPDNFLTEASTLSAGDLVVHIEHGIGRFEELATLDVAGAAHDCLRLVYDGGDKLFVPVENIDVLSRYGDEENQARLDKLGGAAWQARKAGLKQRLREMADQLIAVAAARELQPGDAFHPEQGAFEEFCSGFPFSETEDQARAIDDVVADLAKGRPMDRLICGDVGFGKTEIALRAAFISALEGKQVAVVVPTTLLARQHFQVFSTRFKGFPVRIAQLSRLVSVKDAKEAKDGLADGTVDIVIGTHAVLAKDVKFQRLGLMIIDEEQHFGVGHKEQLKQMKAGVHVLTLTATPIPRTLQLALTGVRELSLITTPPVDRLAVRTFVLPKDSVVIREAINRERFRGGQVFYVCPRVADLARLEEELWELIPDLRIAVAHGQLAPSQLEDVMSAFYDGAYDLLLSTNIVESGLDLPTVNTIIIHRADMFGLAQLYQLRGRIGRSKVRGYAYLTLPPNQLLTPNAQRRLEVMQTLDSLGAGFMLASHDLDIRGAGNLLGEEQSGHIREVGIELYQQLLEEAVAEAKSADGVSAFETHDWMPQIDVGVPVLIPADYVPDLGIRLSLYRRIASLGNEAEIEAFAAELIDRFGSLPEEVENLINTVGVKQLCRTAGVEKVEAGPKGAVISFRNDDFSNPAGLVEFITAQAGTAKLRPDHKLVFMRSWDTDEKRLAGARYLLSELAKVAAA